MQTTKVLTAKKSEEYDFRKKKKTFKIGLFYLLYCYSAEDVNSVIMNFNDEAWATGQFHRKE